MAKRINPEGLSTLREQYYQATSTQLEDESDLHRNGRQLFDALQTALFEDRDNTVVRYPLHPIRANKEAGTTTVTCFFEHPNFPEDRQILFRRTEPLQTPPDKQNPFKGNIPSDVRAKGEAGTLMSDIKELQRRVKAYTDQYGSFEDRTEEAHKQQMKLGLRLEEVLRTPFASDEVRLQTWTSTRHTMERHEGLRIHHYVTGSQAYPELPPNGDRGELAVQTNNPLYPHGTPNRIFANNEPLITLSPSEYDETQAAQLIETLTHMANFESLPK